MNLLLKRFNIFLLAMVIAVGSNGQTDKIDHIREQYTMASTTEAKREAIMKMCDQFFSLSTDSLLRYINLGKKNFIPGSSEYLRLQNYYCIYLYKTGKIVEGMALNDSLIRMTSFNTNPDPVSMEIISTKCSGLIRNGQNKEAIEQCFVLLQAAEKLHDTISVVKAYTFLGWANMELDQNDEAIKWLRKGINYTSNPAIVERGSNLFSNIAACYDNINNPDSAFYNIELALKYSRSNNNLTTLANALNIRAAMYIKKNNYVAAENDMQEAIKVRQKIGDMLYVTSDMASLSSFYASINKTDKGIELAKNGIELAKKSNNLSKLIFLYESLGENYQKADREKDYASTLQAIINLKDSQYKQNAGDAIAEMEAKYQLQKKENIIIKQNYDLTRSRYTAIGSVIILVAGLLLVWLLYRNYRLIQHRKMELAMAEQKLLAYKAVEQAEENERKRIAANLHDNLGSYAAAITANVKNLKEGADSGADMIMAQLDENAQSMVTQLSDTIWVLKNEQLPITKLADRFKVWVQRLIQNYPQVKYHYTEHIINDIEFTPVKILHIFLILKECVNNALKHSDCSDLIIHFFSEDNWVICIEDNGTGFKNNNIASGSGISNIKYRAAECGWNVEWENLKPSGTLVIISETTTK